MPLALQGFTLLLGEALLGYGLWLAWQPLFFIVFGVQVVAGALLREPGERS